MQLQCPCCGEQFPIEAGFADADGKKLAAMLAGLDPGFHVNLWTRLADPDKTRRWINIGHAVAGPFHGAAEAPRRTGGDTWLRLPALNPADNPWLAQRGTYRY